MKEHLKKKKSLVQLAKEFSSRTSIHGIGHVSDKELGYFERFLWLLVTLALLGLAITLTWNTWTQWREEQVLAIFNLDQRGRSSILLPVPAQ